ncbi:hypothetical protein RclHR1_32280003 [Rhizophagus clarus]|uniref:Uncharacterized protein n=1 Tax=Rhizophagus clarus TaxID=94130 RepID=A0A2Z6RPF7_9GLOM|nr:hypothetical protein RclHR1_32280003 [Rhizophagus clarus]
MQSNTLLAHALAARNVFIVMLNSPSLPLKQLEYIQESISQFGYSLNPATTFKLTFCPACNSAFQRKKSNTNSKSSTLCEIVVNLESNSNRNIPKNDELIHTKSNSIESDDDDLEIGKKLDAKQEITFNLIIKPFTGSALPSKWMEIQVSSLVDILVEIHFYVEKLTGNKDIMHSDYLVLFKSEKAIGVRSQLVDLQDYKKFLLDYENLIEKRKNMAIIVSLKKDKKQKRGFTL